MLMNIGWYTFGFILGIAMIWLSGYFLYNSYKKIKELKDQSTKRGIFLEIILEVIFANPFIWIGFFFLGIIFTIVFAYLLIRVLLT